MKLNMIGMLQISKAVGCLILALKVTTVSAEWVEWIAEPNLSIERIDNINYSTFDNEQEKDSVFIPSVSLGRFYQLADHTRLRLTLDLSGRFHEEFSRLDQQDARASFAIRHKLGVGIDSIWVRPHLKLGYLNVSESVRDSKLYEFGVTVGKRLNDRVDVSAAVIYKHRDGRSGERIVPIINTNVFDQSRIAMRLRGNMLLTNRMLAHAQFGYVDGDFDSTCTSGNVGRVLKVEDVQSIISDSVFGGCAYRFEGDARSYSLGFAYALTRDSSFTFNIERQKGDGNVWDYENTIMQASFRYGF